MTEFTEAPRTLEIKDTYDVIVCGSGPAGIAAAIASARTGAKTCLIELKGSLGGTWTSGLLTWIIDYQEKNGIIREIIDSLITMSGDQRPSGRASFPFNAEDMKLVLERKCIEAGVHIRLHTRVVAAHKEDRQLKYIISESKSGCEAWAARTFIDCTGDGDLAYVAGCEYDFASPENGYTQPMSLLCLLTGIHLSEVEDVTNGYNEWSRSKELLKADLEKGGIEPSYGYPTLFHLYDDVFMLMANHQYKYSALNADDVTEATLRAREEVYRQVQALRSIGGRWKSLQLVATAEQIGTREGRRIHGIYQLKAEDLYNGAEFQDAVCKCRFCIDVHSTDPGKEKGIVHQTKRAKPYDIPLRSLISKDVDNLMMAGRCISGDFLAHSSYRVTGTAAPMGEAAGVCAALASLENINPEQLAFQKVAERI